MTRIAASFFAAVALALLAAISIPLAAQDDRDVAAAPDPYVYEVDTLENGEAPGDNPLDLETPRGLVESFMAAGEVEDWQTAAAALDFDALDDPDQTARELYAAQLYDLLHRSVSISWTDLPDRPDAVDTQSSKDDPMAGTPRRSLTVARLALNSRLYPMRIARLQPEGGEPVWVFSRQTVDNVPELYGYYGPTGFERALPDWARKQAFLTLAWWEVVALPIILLAGGLAAALTYKAISRLREGVEGDTKLGSILSAVHIPLTLLAFAGTIALVRATFFRLSGPVRDILDPLQLLLIVFAVIGIVLSVMEALFDLATSRRSAKLEAPENYEDRNFYTRLSAIRRIITAIVMLGGVGFLLVASDLSTTLGFSIMASAGVLGLVLVFAGRKALGDIMASVQIAFAQTARIGDAIHYDGKWCYVEKIGFTHLRLRTADEKRLIAPVSDFTDDSFENWTRQDASLIVRAECEFDSRADVAKLREEFCDFAKEDDGVIDVEDAACEVISHDAQAMRVRFLARASDPKSGWKLECRIREHMLAFAARLDASAERDIGPAFLKREREVRVDQPRD
ncbi:mechanosensitive ion channel family protein [Aurantiacibacter aquimixticola]|uniref:Mechanosensitive ion channel family protein n=1 Tax=Aurantiacibacter aquimixticola TaxID=1958945 RepID=A0A419RWF9_9SPHN|nr:mechanosensitive ion channel family protein [Aurantiacibacter aquimixticola]RJY10118.1 mechanosensitive ion channel family protein [Aurantiacibacter aquimixticola]